MGGGGEDPDLPDDPDLPEAEDEASAAPFGLNFTEPSPAEVKAAEATAEIVAVKKAAKKVAKDAIELEAIAEEEKAVTMKGGG